MFSVSANNLIFKCLIMVIIFHFNLLLRGVMLCIQICGSNILTISNINPTSNSCHGQPQPGSLVLLKIYKNILGIENIWGFKD